MKIFTFDIETSPHEGYHWGVWQQNIAPGQIIVPTGMMTWAGKWLGEREITYRTWDDADFHELLKEKLEAADLIVGYNHDKFDLRHVNREFLERGISPPRPCATVDLLKIVKQRFNFPHNRLDYVASRILGETKLETGGFDLWPAFIRGESKARKIMGKYNRQDVRLTEKLYVRLRPWITNHPHCGPVGMHTVADDGIAYECPACQSTQIYCARPRRTRCYAIRVLKCLDCGVWFDGKRKKLQ